MKWPADQVEIMLSGFQQFIANNGHSAEEIKASFPHEKQRIGWMCVGLI